MSLNVLVTGATGKQGGALSRVLLAKGHNVFAFTRNPNSASAQALQKLGATIVQGDLEDVASIERAARKADALFAVSSPWDGAGLEAEIRQGINIVDAAHSAGVRHLVYTSVPRANEHTGIPHFDSKESIERHIVGLELPHTIIGPAFFLENLLTPWWLPGLQQGVFAIALSPNRKFHVVATEDIGKFAALVIENRDRFLGKRIDIASDNVSPTEIADVVSRASGHQIRAVQTPIAEVRAYNEDFAIMFDYFENVGMRVDLDRLRRDYPEVGWQTFDQWAKKQDWTPLTQSTTTAA